MMNPQGVYQERFKVLNFQCDRHNRLKVSSILGYMQQICSGQMEQLQMGYYKLLEEDMVFLLSAVRLNFLRRPGGSEFITVSTCPLEPKGARFLRETHIRDEAGELLVHSLSSWLLVSPENRKIYRPSAFPYNMVCGAAEDDGFLRLKLPPLSPAGVHRVVQSDLDVNGHMNNARYADLAMDYIPEEVLLNQEPEGMVIHFKQEVLLGETLEIGVANPGKSVYYIGGSSADTEKFAVQLVF